MRKLLDFAHCDDDTLKLSVVNAETVAMPAVTVHQACDGFNGKTPCDGQGILPHTKDGVTRYFCRLHHYVEKLREASNE